MNLFIYDDFVKKYGKIITNIEIELHKLNLGGKIIHLDAIKNLANAIKEEINNGIKTIIIVGNNTTVNKVINALIANGEIPKNLAIGLIPVGNNTSISEIFGIKNYKTALEIILARRFETIAIAEANSTYFILDGIIDARKTIIKIDSFTINSTEKGEIRIINLPIDNSNNEKCSTQNILKKPLNEALSVCFYRKSRKNTHISAKSIEIESPSGKTILLDDVIEVETPAKITTTSYKLNFIVGKNRLF
jgi:diacylglycerol kinase family enzyme